MSRLESILVILQVHCQSKLKVGSWYFLSSLQLPTLAQRKVLDKKSGWQSVLLPETSNRCYFATLPNLFGFPSQGLHTGIYIFSFWKIPSNIKMLFAASSATWFWFPRGQRGTQSSLVCDKYFTFTFKLENVFYCTYFVYVPVLYLYCLLIKILFRDLHIHWRC